MEAGGSIRYIRFSSSDGAMGQPAHTQAKPNQPTRMFGWCSSEWEKLSSWLLEVEMGMVWAVSGLSLISFIFTSIWYIDPALLTMVLQFQPAACTTVASSHLVGISNCTWTSCRHGCTSDIFKCWHILVNFTVVSGSRPIPPPWASISSLALPAPPPSNPTLPSRLYPNVRGCGYPPELQCEDFYSEYGSVDSKFPCWVSHMDPAIILTDLDLKKLKDEVMYSLVPLGMFILSTLYALCRLGVFSICNPLRCCPRPPDSTDKTRLTPKQLFRYKKALMVQKTEKLTDAANINIPPTIVEDMEAVAEPSNSRDNEQPVLLLDEDAEQQDTNHQPPPAMEADGGGGDGLGYQTNDFDNEDLRFNLEELSSVLEQLENHNVPSSYQQRSKHTK